MHLCTNILLDKVIPQGERVRRNFFFWPDEKSLVNRKYRSLVDWWLSKRYRLTDFFFALSQCLQVARLMRVTELAKVTTVELMAHPVKVNEYACLMSNSYFEMLSNLTEKIR